MPTIVTLPGDGIGPEVLAATLEILNEVAPDLDVRGAPHRRRGDRRHRHRAPGRDARRRRDLRRRAARRGRRPEVGHHRPGQAAPRAGAARPAPGPRPVRQPAARPPAPRALRREPAQARDHRAHRPARRARAHRRHLLRRKARTDGHAPPTSAPTPTEEIERIARTALRGGALAGHQRRQGQRARDQPAVAGDRHAGPRPRVPEHRARAPARRQRRDAAGRRPPPLRRDPHREHVRRHPQRRGGDAHRLHRAAPQRLARRRTDPASSNPSTARRPTSPARGSPTRWR